jgi:uncharacterized membrane protein (DUF106 family)
MPHVGFLLAGVIIAGVAYFIHKNSTDNSNNSTSIKKLLSDDDKYNTYKTIIENAIKEKDWQTLEDFLDSRAKNYSDLVEMIKEALKEKR